ncbi:MAG: ATP-binding cassette domain-containing protein [Bacteroidales bacterium]|nr:ATP-binding cassette domain-containing protein [Bacteroidales bacterium]
MNNLFDIKNLRCSYDKNYQEGKSKVVLEIGRLAIPRGKVIFIVGESGIGKSTILETLGMMNDTIVPSDDTEFAFSSDSSECFNLKALWSQSGDKALSNFRLKHYSFIFQSTNLMRNFTAFENVAFTRMLQGYGKFHCFQRTRQVLDELGMEHITPERKVHELSGGQQQRLAFARAILPDFTVLFGDEPTGNLDAENAVRVMSILANKLKSMPGASAIIVSHDMHLAVSFADVIVKIRKCVRPRQSEHGEDVVYGKIDEQCVFTHNGSDRQSAVWSNGSEEYSASEFENFLRKK